MRKFTVGSHFTGIHILVFLVFFFAGALILTQNAQAQIYEPEGLNMPGAWNTWTNPPVNNLALASSTEVVGGRVARVVGGTPRYQTYFSVAASGADIVGGTYDWLFTSGPVASPWGNKWSAVNVTMNTLQQYTKEGAANNNITLVNGKWYTLNFEDLGYVNTRAIFMQTSAQPVNISNVSVPSAPIAYNPVAITVTVSLAASAEEIIYIRYTADSWATSAALPVSMTGTSGTVNIPGQTAGTVVSYYAFTSTVAAVTADFDLVTIKLNNNSGTNYSYTVLPAPPVIAWANLQYPGVGNITVGSAFLVYGQAFIPGVTGQATPAPGLQAWVGYSTTNTDPSTWTNWIAAPYNAPAGSNDEFMADLGAVISSAGTYYYAVRYQLNADAYKYGGFSAGGGGFWDGTTNISGVLTVTTIPIPAIDWANLQWPGSGFIQPGAPFSVYGQAFIAGITGQPAPAPGLLAWVGYSSSNTNPSTWTDWIAATYSAAAGNNDEFVADLGSVMYNTGIFYYATRFQLNTSAYVYGGFSATGGGFWDGTTNISGVLDVVVGIDEIATSVKLYPNPTAGMLYIDMPVKTSVKIISLLGNTVLKLELGAGHQQIDLSSLTSGVYNLQIISGEKTTNHSIIKK